jgi:hypothetical protein
VSDAADQLDMIAKARADLRTAETTEVAAINALRNARLAVKHAKERLSEAIDEAIDQKRQPRIPFEEASENGTPDTAETELDACLRAALLAGDSPKRAFSWAKAVEEIRVGGATDSYLIGQIEKAFGKGGSAASKPGGTPYHWADKYKDLGPAFWYGVSSPNGKPTLVGSSLLKEVRRLYAIPTVEEWKEKNAAWRTTNLFALDIPPETAIAIKDAGTYNVGELANRLINGETFGLSVSAIKAVEAAIEKVKSDQSALPEKSNGKPKRASKSIHRNHCWVCGCTENDCSKCIARTGQPCAWADDKKDLCSACQPLLETDLGILFMGTNALSDQGTVTTLTAAGIRTIGHVLSLDLDSPPNGVTRDKVLELADAAEQWIDRQLKQQQHAPAAGVPEITSKATANGKPKKAKKSIHKPGCTFEKHLAEAAAKTKSTCPLPMVTQPVGELPLEKIDGFPSKVARALGKIRLKIKTLADLDRQVTERAKLDGGVRDLPKLLYDTITTLAGHNGYLATAARDAILRHLNKPVPAGSDADPQPTRDHLLFTDLPGFPPEAAKHLNERGMVLLAHLIPHIERSQTRGCFSPIYDALRGLDVPESSLTAAGDALLDHFGPDRFQSVPTCPQPSSDRSHVWEQRVKQAGESQLVASQDAKRLAEQLAEYRTRDRRGQAFGLSEWNQWCEFDVQLADGSPVRVLSKPGWDDERWRHHIEFWSEQISPTGYWSETVDWQSGFPLLRQWCEDLLRKRASDLAAERAAKKATRTSDKQQNRFRLWTRKREPSRS